MSFMCSRDGNINDSSSFDDTEVDTPLTQKMEDTKADNKPPSIFFIEVEHEPVLPGTKLGNFLQCCFDCYKEFPSNTDVLMYGLRGFCSDECRFNQIKFDDIMERDLEAKNAREKTRADAELEVEMAEA